MLGGRSENPELWEFLESLRPGENLSGTVAAIERFGVFLALDDGPGHPAFAGVGFITLPELSWRRFDDVLDVVHIGLRVSCIFLQFDTTNLEARLSLRATQPDPFEAFASHTALGQELMGPVTNIIPFGVFIQVADSVEGFVLTRDLTRVHREALDNALKVGDELAVVVTDIDRERRTLKLAFR